MKIIPHEDIAFAMELRSEGIYWRHIAEVLGHSRNGITGAVQRAQDSGYRPSPAPTISRLRLHHTQAKARQVLL